MSSASARTAFLGVDVGTGSVRVVALDETGSCLSSAVENLEIHHPREDYYEQSSQQVWNAVCNAVRRVVNKVVYDEKFHVKGIGFDATCSLVILDSKGHPLSVTPDCATPASRTWDIIMWMDHRAIRQAERINATGHGRLKYVGQQISLEMEPPKILWLKENKPDTWNAVGHIMDLADFLTFKASGSLIRSQCTVVCKFLYDASGGGGSWDWDFWSAIGLPELVNSPKIGTVVQPPGTACGKLTPEAAAEFNLPSSADVAVAVGIIDAHAGVLGVLGASTSENADIAKMNVEEKLAIISGTSACHMSLSKEARFVNGVWGPNFGVILDKYWSNEAGQNVLGPVLDEIVAARTNGQAGQLTMSEAHHRVIEEINEIEKSQGPLAAAEITKDTHIWPDYRGNRSPTADPNSKAVIAGQRLKSDINDPSAADRVSYLAHIQSFAYMTRFIMETTAQYSGLLGRRPFSAIYLCGGLQKNPIYVQTHADVCDVPVIVPTDSEVVARGSAILGACASGEFGTLDEAMRILSCSGAVIRPRKETREYHEKKYRAFRLLGQTEAEIRRIMSKVN